VSVTNGHAALSVPGGANHDPFLGGNQSARTMQPISDVDLDVTVKFDSIPDELRRPIAGREIRNRGNEVC
jgi:hypothetical protein